MAADSAGRSGLVRNDSRRAQLALSLGELGSLRSSTSSAPPMVSTLPSLSSCKAAGGLAAMGWLAAPRACSAAVRSPHRGWIRFERVYDGPVEDLWALWTTKVNRYYYACGCASGAKGLLWMTEGVCLLRAP